MPVIFLHALVKYDPLSKLQIEILVVFGYQHTTKLQVILQLSESLDDIFMVRTVKGGQNALVKDLFVQGCRRV